MKDISENPLEGRPVICPKCGSVHIEFVTEYHKCIWLRLLVSILVILMGYFLLNYITSAINGANGYDYLRGLIIVAIFYIIFQLSVWLTESKTHVQGVCRDCGNIWLLN